MDGKVIAEGGFFFYKKEILKSYGVRVILETLSGQRRDLSQVHIRQTLELYLCQVSKKNRSSLWTGSGQKL